MATPETSTPGPAFPAPCSRPCSRAFRPRTAGRTPAGRAPSGGQGPGRDPRCRTWTGPFDYSVPADLDEAAQAGVRVKVRFNGQELSGFIIERTAESDAGHTLVPLQKVISPVAVLTPAVRDLVSAVAARYAGTVSDVLRVAVPPRMATAGEGLPRRLAGRAGPTASAADASTAGTGRSQPLAPTAAAPPATGWAGYRNGPAFVRHLRDGGSPRAVFNPLQGFGPAAWPRLMAAAVAAVRASGRGAVVVVPDYRDLDQLEKALLEVLPAERHRPPDSR